MEDVEKKLSKASNILHKKVFFAASVSNDFPCVVQQSSVYENSKMFLVAYKRIILFKKRILICLGVIQINSVSWSEIPMDEKSKTLRIFCAVFLEQKKYLHQ